MLKAVETRFTSTGTVPTEHPSDNRSPYTAKQTRDFATALNLVPGVAPMKSSESNGMSKAFAKTFNADDLQQLTQRASNICSASSFFSLAFSSSSCRSRLASETSIPPNLA